jgi:hypothetical protein
MLLKKTTLAALAAGLISSVGLVSPANAITVSSTNCVLTIPTKSVLVRGDYYKTLTLTENDITCADEANPFKSEVVYVNGPGWQLKNNNLYAYASVSFKPANIAGAEYGSKRFTLYATVGDFENVSKEDQDFIRTAGPDAEINTDDDVLVPLTFSNGFSQKYRSDVSVKTKKKGNKIRVTVTVDRNRTNENTLDDIYASNTDAVTVYRDGKAIRTIKTGVDGKVSFTIADKKGKNNYSVVLPGTPYNFEGSAVFVR